MIKRLSSDDWFSKCIRERNDWVCEYCGIDCKNDKGNLHCSHFVSRSNLATRYHPSNAQAHCRKCHDELGGGRWGGGNIPEHAANYDFYFGNLEREVIRQLSKCQLRKHKFKVRQISAHYRQELRVMEQKREDGERGRIEFDPWVDLELFEQEIGIRETLIREFNENYG